MPRWKPFLCCCGSESLDNASLQAHLGVCPVALRAKVGLLEKDTQRLDWLMNAFTRGEAGSPGLTNFWTRECIDEKLRNTPQFRTIGKGKIGISEKAPTPVRGIEGKSEIVAREIFSEIFDLSPDLISAQPGLARLVEIIRSAYPEGRP